MNNSYIDSVIHFFKQKYNIKDVDCKIEFFDEEYSILLGSYNNKTNVITICSKLNTNDLTETLFHELIHWWQFKVKKSLKIENVNMNMDFCQSHRRRQRHKKVSMKLFNGICTDNISYYIKPHEEEARKLSKELSNEWNGLQSNLTIL